MTEKLPAVIFDMDGVIINSESVYLDYDCQLFRSIGVVIPPEMRLRFAGRTTLYNIDMVEKEIGLPVPKQEVIDLFQHGYAAEFRLDYPNIFDKEILPLLKELSERGVKLAIASSSPMERIEEMTEVCHIRQYFDKLVTGRSFPESKPNPAIYLHTAKLLLENPAQCIVIEDSTVGLTAAKNAFMIAVGKRCADLPADLALADMVIDSFQELNYSVLAKLLAKKQAG